MWQGIAAFTRGERHIREGLPCQDYAGFRKFYGDTKENTAFLGCVCDGAGSASHGHLGARMAVRKALKNFSKLIKNHTLDKESFRTCLQETLLDIQRKQVQQAVLYKTSPESFSTTFLLLILTDKGGFAAQVGDGFILIREKENNKYQLVFPPSKGMHINETSFLPLQSNSSVQTTHFKNSIDFCLLATDGIENVALKLPEWEPWDNFFSPLENHAKNTDSYKTLKKDLLKFLRGKKFQKKNQDDKTLVMGWQKSPEKIKDW